MKTAVARDATVTRVIGIAVNAVSVQRALWVTDEVKAVRVSGSNLPIRSGWFKRTPVSATATVTAGEPVVMSQA